MYSPTYISHLFDRGMTVLELPRAGRILKQIMIWSFVVDMILVPSLFVKLFVFERVTPIPVAVASEIGVPVGPATERALRQFAENGLPAQAVKTNTRDPFSVPGMLIALSSDNIQAFEYADHEKAVQEVAAFKEVYARARTATHKIEVHTKVDDTLVLLYLGNQPTIIKMLEPSQKLFSQ